MRTLETSLVFFVLLTVALPTAAQGVEACPVTSSSIVINEIMYDPPGAPDVEYIEIYNDGATPVDLTAWFLLDDVDTHDRCFLGGTLNPGEYLVVAGFISLFSAKYPGVTNINANEFDDALVGQGFALGDGGDAVRLFDASGVLMDCVVYNDTPPWPTEPDGTGPSLELYHPSLNNTLATSWAASTNAPPEGTPGGQNTVFTTDQPPIVSFIVRDIPLPSSSDTVTVTATATDLVGLSMVELLVDAGSGYLPQLMFDDGLHGDNSAGDNLFGTQVASHPSGTLVRYYVRATDTAALTTTLPINAPIEYFAYTVDHVLPPLVINEILASNLNGIIDESGTPEDWIEIRNAGAVPVSLKDMYLSNSLLQSMEWKLPDVTIAPGAYLVVWTDDDDLEGPLHTNFKLSASGSTIAIWETVDHGNVMIQGYKFGVQSTDVSFGYFPEASGDAPEYLTTPTPGASNDASTLFSAIAINEFQTTSATGGVDDWVELYNRGTVLVDLSGWHLTDEVDQPRKFTFPNGVFISPGAFVVLDETTLGFAFSSTGSEVIMLTDASGNPPPNDEPDAGKDFFDYGPQQPDITQGRFPDGTANWFSFQFPTQGLSNNCDAVPPAEACDDGDPCTLDVCSGGSVCVYSLSGDCDVSGNVIYYRNNTGGGFEPSTKPVPDVDIDIDTDLLADATTGVNGDYSVDAAGTVEVTTLDEIVAIPHPIFNAAVTSFDATFVAQHSVFLTTLSANQFLAGDVTGNGEISAFDAALIAQFAVKLIDHFTLVDPSSDWAFLRCDSYVDASSQDCGAPSYSHNPLLGPEVDDFYAVLYGDVTGNWQPPSSKSAATSDAEREIAARDHEEALRLRGISSPTPIESLLPSPVTRRNTGTKLELHPSATGSSAGRHSRTFNLDLHKGNGIRGMDIELRYDRNRVRIVDVQAGELCEDFNLVTNDLGGIYKAAVYGVLPLHGSGTVLSITVEYVGADRGGIPLRVAAMADERRIPVKLTPGKPARRRYSHR